ncbi:hypothetical protein DUNSADRAFT_9029 [Dunaliella salina]|uniref:(S)-ureidoglycine aminohydrolase cupin domain-containing protein n=1 Tax=Dunaliella salina TaxID=3046 RepID=A0ABQ7GIA1_DUNSA|nr:hypothetical protein DUNSADRAFT_9029 [Dunaliella salina]|eukprot:KAF5834328.1 hypothetical protein DUNSADRAFT_9029 [Dunaliella salina]
MMACTMAHTKPFLAGRNLACTTPRCPAPLRSRRTPAVLAAANKPIFVDSSPSEDFLKSEGVRQWGTWGCGVEKFPWSWSVDEKAYVLEGEVYITPNEGEPGAGQPVHVKKGDYCVFPGGMSCTWDVKQPIYKHFNM